MNGKALIVVVSYNSKKYILKCLNSILNQNYKGWFLVVLDNNSKDGTTGRIREFRNSQPELTRDNFKFISLKKNIGFSGGVNYAVYKFISRKKDLEKDVDFLVLINPDILLTGDALKNLITAFNFSKYIGAVGGLILDYQKDTIQHFGAKVSLNFITSHLESGKSLKEFKKKYEDKTIIADDIDYVTGAFFATRFKLFKKMGGFDTGYRPAYFEELDYCIKLKKSGKKIAVSPNAVSRHYQGASVNKFSKNFYLYYHKNRIRCAVINLPFGKLPFGFLKEEFRWIKTKATRDQYIPLLSAYFLNFILLPYNLIIKAKNHLILGKLRLK